MVGNWYVTDYDDDNDTIIDDDDLCPTGNTPSDEDPDFDLDGCDDCSVSGFQDINNDGRYKKFRNYSQSYWLSMDVAV